MRTLGAAVALLTMIGSVGTGTELQERRGGGRTTPDRVVVLAIEDARAPHPADLHTLLRAATSDELEIQVAAIRALGRLERRDLIPDLIPLLTHRAPVVRAETANALAQALRGTALPGDPDNQQIGTVQTALLRAAASADAIALAAICRSLGRLPYMRADAIRAADAFLGTVLDAPYRSKRDMAPAVAAAARGVQSLARLRNINPPSEETLDRLRRLADAPAEIGRNAVAALAAAGALDRQTVAAAMNADDPEVRRLGARALAGSSSGLETDERNSLIRAALRDSAVMVRFEAVRAWARHEVRQHGCGPLVDALSDASTHIVLVAIDLLGDNCRDDEAITDRLSAEARTPPPFAWHREAHAFVSLAKRSPERAALAMPVFASHQVAHVRKYAARAAGILNDVATLQRLAADEDDNVVEAALPPLRKRLGAESDATFIEALKREPRTVGRHRYAYPYQVFRTAAIELKGAATSPPLVAALLDTLTRVTGHKHETSLDVRLALIERLRELGTAELVPAFTRLLQDSDPNVVDAVADTIAHWTGHRPVVPAPFRRTPRVPSESEWSRVAAATLTLGSGRRVRMTFLDEAPLARLRFLQLAAGGYYNGLTFHRIEPNFVLQGGSPNAHEYVGDREFMRDEVSLAMHRRGTIGVSTRGRDTGDAQFFINLVDNPRLDHEYTVFAEVSARDLHVVDTILEGEVITRIELVNAR